MPKQVLVVDDNRAVRGVLSEMLRGEECLVEEASTAQAGTQAAIAGAYDVIVIDMMMPDMTGVDAIQAMRAGGVRCRIIAVSGRFDLLEAARRAGADETLLKPMNPEELISAVKRVPPRAASA